MARSRPKRSRFSKRTRTGRSSSAQVSTGRTVRSLRRRKYFDLYPLDEFRVPRPPGSVAAACRVVYDAAELGCREQGQREAIQGLLRVDHVSRRQRRPLLDALDRLKLTDNTIIVFLSDHGYYLGERGQWMKQSLFERSARAPLIIAGPGVAPKGRATSRIVEFSTSIRRSPIWRGLPAPPGLHGRSLTPLLRNPQAQWTITRHSHRCEARRAAGDVHGLQRPHGQWRYTEWDEGKRGVELYDEIEDPDEMRNLAADPKHKSTVTEMQTVLRRMRGN